ncbi:MAG: GNAT family N-acetyltransferase [Alphaproteobacteria bacterium]
MASPRSFRAAVAPARFPEHLAAVRAIFRAYEQAAGAPVCFQGFERERATLPGAYAPPAGAVLLAFSGDGGVVGCVVLRPCADATAEIKRLFVRPEARGKGLGRRLVEAALDAARAAGYHRAVLETHATMTTALALYQALGFVESGDSDKGDVQRLALDLARGGTGGPGSASSSLSAASPNS